MAEVLSCIMGGMDFLAGIIIMYCLDFNTFSLIFGALMIGKGLISFF